MNPILHLFLEAPIPPSPSPTPAPFGTNLVPVAFFCSTMIWAPVILAAVIATLPNPRGRNDSAMRWIALWTMVGLLVINLLTYSNFQTFGSALQYEEKLPWLPALGVTYHLGLDGMGMGVLLLSSIVGLAAVLASWNVRIRVRSYFALLLLLQACVNAVISSHDAFVSALFLSAAVVPAGLLVTGWGGPARARAGARLFGYLGLGAAAFWASMLVLWSATGSGSFDLDVMLKAAPPLGAQVVAGALLLVTAATWLPIFPLHGWARDALSESTPGVALILAGSATRLGGYLLLRILIVGEHDGAVRMGSSMAGLAVATALYAGVLAIAEVRARSDLRRVAATLAMLPGAITLLAISGQSPMAFIGAIFALYAGGLAAALLVAAAATTSERAETRSLAVLGGIGLRAPVLTWIVILAGFAVLGFPGFASYLAWLMTLLGSIRNEPGGTFGVLAGLVLCGAAVAALLWRVLFAPPTGERIAATESTLTERLYLSVLVTALIWVGIVPSGPKVAGVPIFDPGYVNVTNASTTTEADPYAVPVPKR
jgi:NADH-quinone oxidoreductase subunit M